MNAKCDFAHWFILRHLDIVSDVSFIDKIHGEMSHSLAKKEIRYPVGAKVRFTIVSAEYLGRIVEDRGLLGVGRRRLYGIQYLEDQDEPRYIELPAEELRPVS